MNFISSKFDVTCSLAHCPSTIKRKIIHSFSEPRYLSIILLKNPHLFKITKSIISFCLKKNYNSIILNRCESFSGMVDHVTCAPCEPYNFSIKTCKYILKYHNELMIFTWNLLRLTPKYDVIFIFMRKREKNNYKKENIYWKIMKINTWKYTHNLVFFFFFLNFNIQRLLLMIKSSN